HHAASAAWPAEEPVETPPVAPPVAPPVEPRVAPAATPVAPRSSTPRHAQPSAPASGDDRPPLPRRRRQANLAPQLAAEVTPAEAGAAAADDRPAEQARETMAAFQRGTRLARDAQEN